MDLQKSKANDDMKSLIRDYLKDNIFIDVDVGWCTNNYERRVTVSLFLDGEKLTSSSDRLPL